MTALDRALIKVYREERGEPAVASLTSAPGPWFHRHDRPPSEAFSIHAPHAVLAGPHQRLAGHLTIDPPAEAVHLTSRPLTTFAADAQPADDGRPQWVVDRFAWPEVCGAMRNQTRGAIADFVQALLTDSSKAHQAVALVGTELGAGCTAITLCLARQLASQGLRAAIVDADLARPGMADQLSVKVSHGWDAAMTGILPLGEVLIESLAEPIVLAPLREPISAEKLMRCNQRASVAWRMLREPNDVILLDAGTFDENVSLAPLKALCEVVPLDGVYAVCDTRATSPQELVHFARCLNLAGVKLLGVIENFASSWSARSVPAS